MSLLRHGITRILALYDSVKNRHPLMSSAGRKRLSTGEVPTPETHPRHEPRPLTFSEWAGIEMMGIPVLARRSSTGYKSGSLESE